MRPRLQQRLESVVRRRELKAREVYQPCAWP